MTSDWTHRVQTTGPPIQRISGSLGLMFSSILETFQASFMQVFFSIFLLFLIVFILDYLIMSQRPLRFLFFLLWLFLLCFILNSSSLFFYSGISRLLILHCKNCRNAIFMLYFSFASFLPCSLFFHYICIFLWIFEHTTHLFLSISHLFECFSDNSVSLLFSGPCNFWGIFMSIFIAHKQ